MEDHGVVRVVHLERPQLHIRNNPSLTAPSEVCLSLSDSPVQQTSTPISTSWTLLIRRAGEEWMLVLSEGQELIAQIGPLSVGVYVLCS